MEISPSLQELRTSLSSKDGLVVGLSLVLLILVTKVVYNLYFHPLSRVPGPPAYAISRIPYLYRSITGTLPFDMLEFHKRYGNAVRIAPDEVAFAHPNAWNEIQGHRKGEAEMEKAPWFYRPLPDDPLHIVNERREQHGKLRRQMSHGFSERNMRDQEPMIRGYVDLLMRQLRRLARDKTPVVLSDWYNYTTFDIIGDLAFGEPFGCLEGAKYDDWIRGIFVSGRLGTVLHGLSFFPLLKRLCFAMVPQSMKEARDAHIKSTREKMLRRMARSESRPDLIEGLLKKKDELNLSVGELVANAEILIIGGSETTATLLSGVTFLLLKNPEAYTKLTHEVRSAFRSEDEINIVSVSKLTYMMACLDEALRMYPPVANGLPRVTPKGGATVMGIHIPEQTYVSVHHWALYRREDYFKEPNVYHPERFLGDPKFETDQRDVLQPFHVGPRACLGRNLAYSEMRLILALMIFNFDMTLADDSHDWMEQRNYLMWQKGPLKVNLTLVRE